LNSAELRSLADDRLLDAQALLSLGRWSAAYYLAGYAVESAWKACILKRVTATGLIFEDHKFAAKCWTHNLEDLSKLAGLDAILGQDVAKRPGLDRNWSTVRDWSEASRYRQTTESDARMLYDAISNRADGVLPWIRNHW